MNSYRTTVLTANYNNGQYLIEFFKSILNSSLLPDEIVFVDDGSIDESVEIVNKYKNEFDNFIFIRSVTNNGFANALNIGLSYVTSDYILRIDPDDILHPKRIETQVNILKSNPKIDVLGSNVIYFGKNINEKLGTSNFPLLNEQIISRYSRGYHGLVHGSIIIKSEILKKVRYDQDFVPAEEYDLFSKILCNGYVAQNSAEYLTFVRIHFTSASYGYPISTFRKIVYLQSKHWGVQTTKLNFYRKYFMIYMYRKSLGAKGIDKLLYKLFVGMLAPNILVNRLIYIILK